MSAFYWTFEYLSVFFGYLFLMFLWPTVVFYRHLRGRSLTYRFCFCVTVQPVIVSTVVLIPGLFHVLDRRITAAFFYAVFFVILLFRSGKSFIRAMADIFRTASDLVRSVKIRIKGHIWDLAAALRPGLPEYVLLFAVLIFGMIYFSYGSFQVHSYGFGDLYAHHAWIYGLMDGRIFSDGVYPEAMHCFIYTLNAMFDIPVYSILLYLQCIHVAVFLLSAYCLLKEIFHWRYTPIFVLAMFLTLDVVSADQVYGMSRLQWTLPLEFGLHTQFLCALFLVRFVKNAYSAAEEGENPGKLNKKLTECFRNENLFLFMMALAASVAIHYYTTIMAFIVCVSFAVFFLKRIFSRRCLLPLVTAVVCGVLIAVIPMVGALASGIPFNYSIRWAVNSMDGESTREFQEEQDAGEETESPGDETASLQRAPAGSVYMAGGSASVKDGSRRLWTTLAGIYSAGYRGLYGSGRGGLIFALTLLMTALCIAGKKISAGPLAGVGRGYGPMILASVLFIVTYAAPYVGLPEIISDSRFCSAGHMMILAVALMPVDAVFSMASSRTGTIPFCGEGILQALSFLFVAGIYAVQVISGNFHGFLFYELTRYNSVVETTISIIDSFPEKSFVLVSPTDELYPVIEDGWHEELLTFVNKSRDPDYELSLEYIFFYVEKKPLLYAQAHFFTGPDWLGREKYKELYWDRYSKRYPHSGASQSPHIEASEVSQEEAGKDMMELGDSWQLYTRLESRTILESKAYDWCQRFMEQNPYEMYVYYEDEDFVCYYLVQDVNIPYKLGVE